MVTFRQEFNEKSDIFGSDVTTGVGLFEEISEGVKFSGFRRVLVSKSVLKTRARAGGG